MEPILAHNCIASGPGLESPLQAGIATGFVVFARTANGSIASHGGARLSVTCIPPPRSPPALFTVSDHGNGTYGAFFQPRFPGRYTISVCVDDNDIPNSPFSVEIVLPSHVKCAPAPSAGTKDDPVFSRVFVAHNISIDRIRLELDLLTTIASAFGPSSLRLAVTLSPDALPLSQPSVLSTASSLADEIRRLPAQLREPPGPAQRPPLTTTVANLFNSTLHVLGHLVQLLSSPALLDSSRLLMDVRAQLAAAVIVSSLVPASEALLSSYHQLSKEYAVALMKFLPAARNFQESRDLTMIGEAGAAVASALSSLLNTVCTHLQQQQQQQQQPQQLLPPSSQHLSRGGPSLRGGDELDSFLAGVGVTATDVGDLAVSPRGPSRNAAHRHSYHPATASRPLAAATLPPPAAKQASSSVPTSPSTSYIARPTMDANATLSSFPSTALSAVATALASTAAVPVSSSSSSSSASSSASAAAKPSGGTRSSIKSSQPTSPTTSYIARPSASSSSPAARSVTPTSSTAALASAPPPLPPTGAQTPSLLPPPEERRRSRASITITPPTPASNAPMSQKSIERHRLLDMMRENVPFLMTSLARGEKGGDPDGVREAILNMAKFLRQAIPLIGETQSDAVREAIRIMVGACIAFTTGTAGSTYDQLVRDTTACLRTVRDSLERATDL